MGRDTHTLTRASLVLALTFAGCDEEARSAANGLIDAAESTHNPYAFAFALYAYGRAFHDADPAGARDAVLRGLLIAEDSGNRFTESLLANTVSASRRTRRPACRARSPHAGDPQLPRRGNTTGLRNVLAVLVALLNRLGRYQSAGTMARFALSPLTAVATPEINTAITHLRDVLGDQTYESLAGKGETMTTAAMVTYAYDEIDQARAELTPSRNRRHTRVSKLCIGVTVDADDPS